MKILLFVFFKHPPWIGHAALALSSVARSPLYLGYASVPSNRRRRPQAASSWRLHLDLHLLF